MYFCSQEGEMFCCQKQFLHHIILVGCICSAPTFVMANAITFDPLGTANNIAQASVEYAEAGNKQLTQLTVTKQAYIEGVVSNVDEWKAGANEWITEKYEAGKEFYEEKTQAADSWMEDKYNAASSYVSDAFSSDGEQPGEGFSLSETVSSAKEAISEYGEKMKPAVTLARNVTNPAKITQALFLGGTDPDKMTSYTAATVRSNVKEFIREATKTTLVDATQVINGTLQYDVVQKSSSKAAKKSTTVMEDIKNVTESNLSMNVMTNILLSLDITDLSIQSALIYEDINNLKNSLVKSLD